MFSSWLPKKYEYLSGQLTLTNANWPRAKPGTIHTEQFLCLIHELISVTAHVRVRLKCQTVLQFAPQVRARAADWQNKG